jgi:M6 family metalloprotease-like protein/uncharacterized repeat protein (TIGR02543 family)
MKNNKGLRRVGRGFRLTLLAVFASISFFVAPGVGAPMDGYLSEFTQPDGTIVRLKFFGDEFYARTETVDGYTVIFDLPTRTFFYADLTPDKNEFISTGKAVGKVNPDTLGLSKSLKINPASRAAKARTRYEAFESVLKQEERWKAVKAANRKYREFKKQVKEQEKTGKKGFVVPMGTLFPDSEIPSLPSLASSAEGDGGETGDTPISPAPPSFELTGNVVGLTVVVDFSDVPAGAITQADIDDYCNKPGYNGFSNGGSIYDYFYKQSAGQLRYNNNVTYYVRVPQPKTYYNDPAVDIGMCGNRLLNDALNVLIANGYDFSGLTTKLESGKTRVRACNVFFAGNASPVNTGGLWPHRWALYNTGEKSIGGGVTVWDYQITSIGTSLAIGTFCHENGHMLLGYPDFYDYGYDSEGMGNYSLMAAGNHTTQQNPANIHGYLKWHSGWVDAIELYGAATQNCSARVDFDTIYKYTNPLKAAEYFMIENRSKAGWEANSAVPDSGLLITHNDEGGNKDYQAMTEAQHYETSVEQADGAFDLEFDRDRGDSSDLFHSGGTGPKTSFDDTTLPNAKWWAGADGTFASGTNSGLNIHDISAAGETMTFIFGAGTPSGSQVIGLDANTIVASANYGANAPADKFNLFNAGGGTLNYTITDNQVWLSCTPTNGTATTESDNIAVNFSTSGLGAGSYSGTITVSDPSASPTSKTITVNLTVTPQSTLGVAPVALTPTGTTGLSGPTVSFALENTGGGSCNYTITKTQSWLTVSPTNGTLVAETDTIYVNCNATSLAPGSYSDTITVTSAGAGNSPLNIPVTYTVQGTDMIVTSPNGGETWIWYETNTITWASSLGGTVKIELLKAGLLDTTITGSTTNDGSFEWTVPYGQPAGADYRVKITSAGDTNKWDTGNANFSIVNPPLYLTDFEGSASLPTGMTDVLVSGSLTPTWKIQTGGYTGGQHPSSAHSGTNNAAFYSTTDSTRRLITPAFSTLNHTNLTLEFWHTQEVWPSDQDTLTVYYSTNGGSVWTQLVQYTNSIADWLQETITLPVASTNTKIAFEGYATYGYGVCVDDVSVTGAYFPADPEMAVTRGGVVADGGTDAVSGTEVGAGTQLTYTIANQGGTDLTLTTPVTATPVANCSITVNTQPTSPVASSGSTPLVLTITPTGTGAWSATVSIANNDSDENPYNWTISGTAVIKYDLVVASGTGDGRYASGDVVGIVADAPATGNHFVNWTASGGGTFGNANAASTTYTMPAGNATVTANFALDTYTVTYNANSATSGTPPSNQTKTYGVNLTLAANTGTLARTGYTFSGWNTATNGSGTTYAESAIYTANAPVTLYAKWTANTYTVTFDKQGGSGGSNSVVATYDSAMPAATAPSRAGFAFVGYYTATNGGGSPYYTYTMASATNWNITANTTLYANWVDTLVWDANGITANRTDGPGVWLDPGKWWNSVANIGWAAGLSADFGNSGTGGVVTLASNTVVNSFVFSPFSGTYTLGSASNTITINSGIVKNAGSAAVIFASPITLGSTQTWVNSSSGLLTTGSGANPIDLNGNALTVEGDGNMTFGTIGGAAPTLTGSGALIKNGPGLLSIGGTNSSCTGSVTINTGVLRMYNNAGGLSAGNWSINGGILEAQSVLTLTRSLGNGAGEIQIPGGNSGFSQFAGGQTLTVTLNNNATNEVVWGSEFFNPSVLLFHSPYSAGAALLTLSNKIDLNGTNRTLNVAGGTTTNASATFSGIIRNSSGTAGLIKTGAGLLVLSGANIYNGDTTISEGMLSIGNNSAGTLGAGNYGGNISVANGSTLRIWSTAAQTLGGEISGDGSLHKAYQGALTLSGPNTYRGKTSFLPVSNNAFIVNVSSFNSVNGGTPLLASSSLGAPTSVSNGTIDVGSPSQPAMVTLTYNGPGETTDRVINFGFTNTASQTLSASGSGLLKFTSPMTANALTTQSGKLILDGTGAGEIAATLPALPTGGPPEERQRRLDAVRNQQLYRLDHDQCR